MVKQEIRILGVDDGYFSREYSNETLMIGVVMRGYKRVDGVLSEKIKVDGGDSTEKLIRLVKKSGHYHQIRIIMTNGVTFAGFNVIDPEIVYNETEIPIIIVIRKKPDIEKFLKTIKKIYGETDYRIKIIEKLPKPKLVKTRFGITYYQNIGISNDRSEELIKFLSKYSRIPEPVRVAHLIAMGVTLGYSKGKP